jgi:prepilin-type N-terminal cleavage/methylation domain-containing protein
MLKKLQKNKDGFTIIEVMIVLAIAGLILLIVFLAVPALQRNSHNTTKRSDASNALGAVGEFVSNNNGQVPSTANLAALLVSANLSSGTQLSGIPNTIAAVTAPNINQIEIATGMVCNTGAILTTATTPTAANYQALVTASSTRSYVALYAIEATGGQQTTQCTGS